MRVMYLDVPGSYKLVSRLFHLVVNGVYWGYNPLGL